MSEKVINNRGEKLSTTPRVRARVDCIQSSSQSCIKIQVNSQSTCACAPARVRSEANLKARREKHFGGDFDPVAAIVDEAVTEPNSPNS